MYGTSLSFDRGVAQEVGVSAALLYMELCRKDFYWRNQGRLVDDMFWCDQQSIADWLLMSKNTMIRAIKALEEAGLIEHKTSYKPGTVERTTWWKVKNQDFKKCQNETFYRKCQNGDFYIKANTIATTISRNQENGLSENTVDLDGDNRIKPAQLYSRVHSFFGGRHDRRKAMVEAMEKLQEELSDETILVGCQEIAAHPTFKTKEGDEITWTLSMLLLRDDEGLSRTADIILRAADKREAREKKESKEKKVRYSSEECY